LQRFSFYIYEDFVNSSKIRKLWTIRSCYHGIIFVRRSDEIYTNLLHMSRVARFSKYGLHFPRETRAFPTVSFTFPSPPWLDAIWQTNIFQTAVRARKRNREFDYTTGSGRAEQESCIAHKICRKLLLRKENRAV